MLEQERLRKAQAEQEGFERRKRQKKFGKSRITGKKCQSARIGRVREQVFKVRTVGLVTVEHFVKASLSNIDLPKKWLKHSLKKKKEKWAALLSFQDDDKNTLQVKKKIVVACMPVPPKIVESTTTIQ
jgi:hypothetical protein